MREILFRGKRVDNGEWVEGSLIIDKVVDMYLIYPESYPGVISHVVLPSTVGQYTGLTDKNGKKIFEGDIVKNSRDVGLLYYKEKNSVFTVKGWEYGYWLWHDKEDIEVIGNIYDNKDLLKED